jgi:hypothetical protein
MLVLLFLASLGSRPPRRPARRCCRIWSAGTSCPPRSPINQTTAQAAQVFGYLAGATIATAISPRLALGVDVLTFASRPPDRPGVRPARGRAAGAAHPPAARVGEGFRLVFGRRVLRSIASWSRLTDVRDRARGPGRRLGRAGSTDPPPAARPGPDHGGRPDRLRDRRAARSAGWPARPCATGWSGRSRCSRRSCLVPASRAAAPVVALLVALSGSPRAG